MVDKIKYLAPSWVADAIFYQIFPDRFYNEDVRNDPARIARWGDTPTRENYFGGDLRGILQKLDYLQGIGVNALYLNPIFSAGTNHRYDTHDYFRVDPALGDNRALKELVDECHRRGMHLILDGVFNHCGDGFPPFQDVMKNGADSPYVGWFFPRSYPLKKDPLNYLTCGGCTYLPKLNHENQEVQQLILDVARFWIEETGMDGWRLDVPFKIPLPFWREFCQVVKTAKPDAYLIGEVWRDASPWVQGDTFDGVTNYRLRDLIFEYVLTQVLDGEDFGYELLTHLASLGAARSFMLNLLDSHDTTRVLTTFKGDTALLRIALTIQMTLPGAPMIYYGDEVGLLGETDPDCRRCFPWDEQDWNQQVVSIFRELTQLRSTQACFRQGMPQSLAYFNGLFAYRQASADDEAIVILNPREGIAGMKIPTLSKAAFWQEQTSKKCFPALNGKLMLDFVPSQSAMILLPVKE